MAKGKLLKKRGAGYDVWRALVSNKLSFVCLIIAACLVLLACSVDFLFDYETDVIAQDMTHALERPSAEHWFGTDGFGRDYFARVLYATRVTLILSASATLGAALIATFIGGMVAYYGGWLDDIVMRVTDIFIAVPQTLMIICVVATLGNKPINIVVTLIIIGIPASTRVARAAFLSAKENEYVEAARAAGASDFRIIFGHLLPNAMGPILVDVTSGISGYILATASLGYLGLGIPAPAPEWGRMLSEAQEYMRTSLYLLFVPGGFILFSSVVFNLLGDGIRDAMDPRLRGFRKRKKVRRASK